MLNIRELILCVMAVLPLLFVGCKEPSASRNVTDLSTDWRFSYGDDRASAKEEYVDSAWLEVDLPHAWAIDSNDSLDYVAVSDIVSMNVGWYRKHFYSPMHSDKVVYIEFDSLPAKSRVYINGVQLNDNYDITSYLHPMKSNLLAVRTEDGGISGGVRMVIVNSVFIEHAEVVVANDELSDRSAIVNTVVKITNKSHRKQDITLVNTIHDAEGKRERRSELQMTIAAGESFDVETSMQIPNPVISDEYEYELRSAIVVNNSEVDCCHIPFCISRKSDSVECNETTVRCGK